MQCNTKGGMSGCKDFPATKRNTGRNGTFSWYLCVFSSKVRLRQLLSRPKNKIKKKSKYRAWLELSWVEWREVLSKCESNLLKSITWVIFLLESGPKIFCSGHCKNSIETCKSWKLWTIKENKFICVKYFAHKARLPGWCVDTNLTPQLSSTKEAVLQKNAACIGFQNV